MLTFISLITTISHSVVQAKNFDAFFLHHLLHLINQNILLVFHPESLLILFLCILTATALIPAFIHFVVPRFLHWPPKTCLPVNKPSSYNDKGDLAETSSRPGHVLVSNTPWTLIDQYQIPWNDSQGTSLSDPYYSFLYASSSLCELAILNLWHFHNPSGIFTFLCIEHPPHPFSLTHTENILLSF